MMMVGILGGGQLARMLALAGHPLGLQCLILDPAPDACAAAVAEHLAGDFTAPALLEQLALRADVVTYEFENVPAQSVHYLSNHVAVYPPPAALEIACDRLREKTMFQKLNIATPAFAAINTLDELTQAVRTMTLPAVLKTRTLGYDGKGQAVIRKPDEAAAAWLRLGGVPAILESFVPFERELSIIAARGRNGKTVYYPVTENTHRDGILHLSISRPHDAMQARAEDYIRRILDALNYAGVLTLELFQAEDQLIANEIAPRVHNSGHWTIEGAHTSQFENHLRAILDWPLGDTSPRGYSAMINFVGTIPQTPEVLAVTCAHHHDYGKRPQPGRKLGHATLCMDNPQALEKAMEPLEKLAKGL